MTISDFVKSGPLSKGHIAAAEAVIAPKERVLDAFTANCRTAHGNNNRLVVLTSHRLIFVCGIVKPPQIDIFPLGECIGIGDIGGGLIKRQDYVCGEQRITIEATKEQLQQLTEKTLVAIEGFPNQPIIEFPSPPAPSAAPTSATAPASDPRRTAPTSQHTSATPITKKGQAKQRIAENRAAGIACCPKCGSTSISANRKGYSLGKAAAGVFVAGPIGLVGGTLGANKLEVTCLNCGHKFRPGK